MMQSPTIHFVSELFDVEPGEEEETNPGIFGKQLAYWIKDALIGRGYYEVEVVPEDWGWCVVLNKKPHLVWVGCSGQVGVEFTSDSFENEEGITWSCFIVMEMPLRKRLFGTGGSTESLMVLQNHLLEILNENQDIMIVKETW